MHQSDRPEPTDLDSTNRPEAAPVHIPVLLEEAVAGLALKSGGLAIDGTLGGGGHTARLLAQTAPTGRVLGLYADPEAIARVSLRLQTEVEQGRLLLALANFGEMARVAQTQQFGPVDGVLLDLGISSFQLASPDRGFAWMKPGPLDMRFDPDQPLSAAEIVNEWPEEDLANIIYQYGEDRQSRRIARFLVSRRPIATTDQLARLVEQAVGGRGGDRIHPATRTFQALRIAVNRELEQLEAVLPQILSLLKPGGRVAIISFHSLEDRIVKQWMQSEASDFIHDRVHPLGGVSRTPRLRLVTKKPEVPTEAEIERNPRSRSAKLRIAERI
jgi:16S rRNA (cytosine1402-N4)-methyltransferase